MTTGKVTVTETQRTKYATTAHAYTAILGIGTGCTAPVRKRYKTRNEEMSERAYSVKT